MNMMVKTDFDYAILIVNYNSWSLLTRCLDCLKSQTVTGFKVYVADNASDEPPPRGFFEQWPELVFLQMKKNHGFAEANNRLLAEIDDCDWVLTLNPDAFPEPAWLENLQRAALENRQYSFFSSRLLTDQQPDLIDGDGDCYHFSGLAWRRNHGDGVPEESEPAEVFAPCAAAAMYSFAHIKSIGGFDPDFFCYMEDVDLAFRMQLAGLRCLHVPSATVRHMGSATSGGQKSDFAIYHGHRNLVWTYFKNMPTLLLWLFLPFHLGLNLLSLVWFTAKGKGGAIFRAKTDAFRGIPAVLKKRRIIQLNRKAGLIRILRMLNIFGR